MGLRRPARRILVAAASLAAALLVAELGLRFLLFGESELAREWGAGLREEAYYTHWQSEAAYVLRARFGGEKAERVHPYFHPDLGWTKPGLDPDAPASAYELGGRRPVLLYGDSFAECVTEPEDCWGGLLARSELGGELALVNLGVGGYGLDQIELLLRRTIDRFAELDPVVVVAILVDDDLDRSDLGLRDYPKPRYVLEGDQLVFRPLAHETIAQYIADHPLRTPSYLWRAAVHASFVPIRARWLLTGESGRVARRSMLTRRLIESIRGELEARELDYFFLLFHGQKALHEVGPFGWREEVLYDLFGEHGIPFVSSKRGLLEDGARTGRSRHDYYFQDFPGKNHYRPIGNAAVFEQILRGLQGEFEPLEYMRDAPRHWRADP